MYIANTRGPRVDHTKKRSMRGGGISEHNAEGPVRHDTR